MVVFHVETQGITIAAIANANDHPALLTKILGKVEECFTDMFGEKIDEPDVVSETKKFDERLDEILKGKSAKRGMTQVAQGLILGSIILALLWILVIPLTVDIIISIIVQTVQIALNFISPLNT